MVQFNSSCYRSNYPQDQIILVDNSHSFKGEVIDNSYISEKEGQSIRLVDRAVKVTSVLPEIRKSMLSLFANSQKAIEKAQMGANMARKMGIAFTVLSSLAALGTGISHQNTLISSNTAGLLYASSLAVLVVGLSSIFKNTRALDRLANDLKETETHKEAWADPIDSVILQRQRTGTEGFGYVFAEELKDKTIHPEEVTQLWIDSLAQLIGNEQKDLSAFKQNLFGENEVSYAWPDNYIHELEINNEWISGPTLNAMAAKYRACHANYQVFDSLIKGEVSALQSEFSNTKRRLEEQRAHWMQPVIHTYENGLLEAKYLYHSAIHLYREARSNEILEVGKSYSYEIHNPESMEEIAYKNEMNALRHQAISRINKKYKNADEVKQIKMNYRQDYNRCNFLYEQTKGAVNAFFNQRIDQLESEYQYAQTNIVNQREREESIFRGSLNQMITTRDPFEFELMSVPFPAVNREWQLTDFNGELSWNDVYGRIPPYNSSFAENLSQAAWNKFWSNQGFGKYASVNCNWNQRPYDRLKFPLRQEWFNLHKPSPKPTRDMFHVEIEVPPPPKRQAFTPSQATGEGQVSSNPNGIGLKQRPSVGFGGTTRRAEKRNDAPPANSFGANTQTSVGFGGTTRREEKRNDTPPANSFGANTQTSVGLGGTTRR